MKKTLITEIYLDNLFFLRLAVGVEFSQMQLPCWYFSLIRARPTLLSPGPSWFTLWSSLHWHHTHRALAWLQLIQAPFGSPGGETERSAHRYLLCGAHVPWIWPTCAFAQLPMPHRHGWESPLHQGGLDRS